MAPMASASYLQPSHIGILPLFLHCRHQPPQLCQMLRRLRRVTKVGGCDAMRKVGQERTCAAGSHEFNHRKPALNEVIGPSDARMLMKLNK